MWCSRYESKFKPPPLVPSLTLGQAPPPILRQRRTQKGDHLCSLFFLGINFKELHERHNVNAGK